MKFLRDWFIPDEWQSAGGSIGELFRDVRKTSHAWLKHVVTYGAVWSVGALAGHAFWRMVNAAVVPDKLSSSLDGVVRAILTMSGILAGFMITLMLFTGKTEAWKALTLEQAQAFVSKANYLLFSQFVTLTNHVAVICTTIGWFLFAAAGHVTESYFLMVMMFGFLLVSILRTMLVPMQIAELHRFALGALLADKQTELQQSIDKSFRES